MIYIESGYAGEAYNLDHPRILWNSVCRRGTVVASTEAVGYSATNAATATTFDRWKPTGLLATWDLTFDQPETVSAVGVASHNMGSNESKITIQEWDGSAWVNIMAGKSPPDNEPVAFLFSARSLDRIRIRVTAGTGPGTPPEIGVIHVCEALEIPQKSYSNVPTPIDMAIRTEYDSTRAARGQYLGRSIVRQSNMNDFAVAHLEESWVRGTLMPFVLDAREYPYLLLERPGSIGVAISYRWRDDDIRPARMGAVDLMEVRL